MKIKKLMGAVILGLSSALLLYTSIALAASEPSQVSAEVSQAVTRAFITPTQTVSPTETTPHPVVAALAGYFEVEDAEIAALHESGLGFGVIARAYFLARQLQVSPQDLLADFQSGLGWGEIAKAYGLHPGHNGRGGSVGVVMSGRGSDRAPGPPGVPPGQAKKSVGNEIDDDAEDPNDVEDPEDDETDDELENQEGPGNNNGRGQGNGKDKGRNK